MLSDFFMNEASHIDSDNYVSWCDLIKPILDTVNNTVTSRSGYKGTYLHHLVRSPDVSLDNLPYVAAVFVAYGADLYSTKDSDGYSVYALITRHRYPGRSCLELDIYREIDRLAIHVQDNLPEYLLALD